MSDLDLRLLERRWSTTGDHTDGATFVAALERGGVRPEHQAQWLAAKVRIGGLHEERLALAAHLGFPPAVEAFSAFKGHDAATAKKTADEIAARPLEEWSRGLYPAGGYLACARAALAGAQAGLEREPGESADVHEALRAAAKHLEQPSLETYEAAEAFNARRGDLPLFVFEAVTASHCPGPQCSHHALALVDLARVLGDGRVREVVRDALIPWILDPTTELGQPIPRPDGKKPKAKSA